MAESRRWVSNMKMSILLKKAWFSYVGVSMDLSPTFLNTRTTDETFQQSGKQDSWKVEIVFMKVQAHSSLEKPLEYN